MPAPENRPRPAAPPEGDPATTSAPASPKPNREGWCSEAEGLRVSFDAATSKLAQADLTAARHVEAVNLGIPAYRDIAAATLTAGDHRDP